MRYVLFPGYVVSQNDGDWHYISAEQLAVLYGVDYRKCVTVDRRSVRSMKAYGERKPGDIHLFPQDNGDYSL